MIKLKVRECSLKYASIKKANLKNTEAEIEASILYLERRIERNDVSDQEKRNLKNELNNKKQEFEQISRYKTKGYKIRNRARWYNEREINSKYFLSLEKRHCKINTIGYLKTENGTSITSDKEILKECKMFYTNLYRAKPNDAINDDDNNYFLSPNNQCKLTPEETDACEGELREKECLEALRTMKNEKSPGNDGIPVEFYKVFWKDISTFYINAINTSYESEKLSVSQ